MGNQCVIDDDEGIAAWNYCPSVGAAAAISAIFGLITIVHIYQASRYRKKFCWVIIMSCIWEVGGFLFRVISAKLIYGLWHFIIHQTLVILAPIWLNGFVFMTMGRMINFLLPEREVFGISARKLTITFVLLDIFSFLVQSSAARLLTVHDNPTLVQAGINIYMSGIALQEFFIILFIILTARFQYKMARHENSASTTTDPSSRPMLSLTIPWRRLLYAVYAALFFISVRIIYRLVEYSGGMDSDIARNEPAFYFLEAAPMVLALGVFHVVHPGMILVGEGSEFPKLGKAKVRSHWRRGVGMMNDSVRWLGFRPHGQETEAYRLRGSSATDEERV